MQKRLLILLGLIAIYRFLAHVPVPLAEPAQLKDIVQSVVGGSDFGGFVNLLTGGALAQLSIVLVGLGPYIVASLAMQLMTRVIPRLEELHKDGESGRRQINQWTRVITVPLAIMQSFSFVYLLRQTVASGGSTTALSNSWVEWAVAVIAMTAGSVLLMWLGELMTEQGIGNGISLLIFAGIISQLPQTIGSIATSLFASPGDGLNVFGWFTIPVDPTTFYITILMVTLAFFMLYILVKINEAQRIITINYAKRVDSNSAYGGVKSILPVKLIIGGVMPIIFALSLLNVPAFIGQIMKAMPGGTTSELANNLTTWFNAPTANAYATNDISAFIYPAVYFVLVILFTYFYTDFSFNTKEISENMQKQGGFVDGVRPGAQTDTYLKSVVTRLVFFGSITLGLVAIMPFIIQYIFAQFGIQADSLAIGGTSLLIVVSVGLETMRQLNSRALMVTYDDYK